MMSSTSDGLQEQLDVLNGWCTKWCLCVNTDKTNIMHVRKASTQRSDVRFMISDKTVNYVTKYRYLGFTLSDTMNYNIGVDKLVTGSSKALGCIVSTYFQLDGMDYDTFTKLYNGTVSPIMEYSSGVWGYKVYERLERLQYRAIRTFLGVGKFTPIPAITGEMGWTPPYIRNRCNMIRLWCRLVNLDTRRIPYIIFKWDMNFSIAHRETWSNDVKSIMTDCGLRDLFDSSHTDGREISVLVC